MSTAGWQEASTGAVLRLDRDGDVLSSRHFGRLPEEGKRRPGLRLIAAADAAPDNWT